MLTSTIFLSLLLLSSLVLAASTSLPLQAFALFFMSIFIASLSGATMSPLIGIYMILIYSSGLLVLLAYFVALSPDQTLNFPFNTLTITVAFFMLLISSQTSLSPAHAHASSFSPHSNIITILNPHSASLLITIGFVLILTMISVIKVLSLSSKPMRPWA